MTEPLLRQLRRAVRKGSRWRDGDGSEVVVSFNRRGIVAYLYSRDGGGLLYEEDFRERFEWVAGR